MVSTNKRKATYTCNGTGPYVINFPVEFNVSGNAKNIKAQIDENDPLAADKYTVTGLNVTTVDSYDGTHQITIYRETPATQTLDYQSGGGAFDLNTLEKQGLDRAILLIQERLEEIERTLKAPISDPAGIIEIPGKTTRISKHLAFDADGKPIASEGVPNVPATAWAATLLDDEDVEEARTTLDVLQDEDDAIKSSHIDWGGGADQIDLDEVPDGATYQKVHGDYVDANGKVDSIKEQNGVRLLCKVIEIGDWNMDSDIGITVDTGLGSDYKKIRSVSVIIRNNDDSDYYPLDAFVNGTDPYLLNGGITQFLNTGGVYLRRRTGGLFDNSNFDSTSYNRGWLTIWYEE